jgi:hypothetical protein
MADSAKRHSSTSDYWLAVHGVLRQLEGLLEGLQHGCPTSEADRRRAERGDVTGLEYLRSLSRPAMLNLLLLNANGDLYQISDKFKVIARLSCSQLY